MPELPEVECVRRSLEASVLGARVESARLLRRDMLTQAPPRVSAAKALLEGTVIARIERLGKHLAIVGANGRVLEIHLGMSGQVLLSGGNPGNAPRQTHVHAVWLLRRPGAEAMTLRFRDPRRFGGLWSFMTFAQLVDERWSRLGVDALTITPTQLRDGLGTTTRAIKAALLDQGVLAGVGNIYADEALHLSGINPEARANTLQAGEVRKLAGALRRVTGQAIRAGGSTLRDYRASDGSTGRYQKLRRVYGRYGQACPVCGTPLRRGVVGGRTTSYCPVCQARIKPGR